MNDKLAKQRLKEAGGGPFGTGDLNAGGSKGPFGSQGMFGARQQVSSGPHDDIGSNVGAIADDVVAAAERLAGLIPRTGDASEVLVRTARELEEIGAKLSGLVELFDSGSDPYEHDSVHGKKANE